MTDERPGPHSPADEQRTTALPRPARPPQTPTGARPPQPPDPPPPDETPSYETTVLRRPDSPPPAGSSNLPGAHRPQPHQPPAYQPPQRQWPATPPTGYPGTGPPPYTSGTPPYTAGRPGPSSAQHGYRPPPATDPRARRDYPTAEYPREEPPSSAWQRTDDEYDHHRHGPYPDEPRHRPDAHPDGPRDRRSPSPSSRLPPYQEPDLPEDPEDRGPPTPRGLPRAPRKLTVTRVAALRSRELTHRGMEKFHGAVTADGADRSGLGHLTYAVMANYAVDAALAVALANTLFFAAAKADSTGKVLLYLLLTVAPFAIIAPLIGPLLDRLQNGRRIALAASSFGRAALAVVMAVKFDSWVIYPCALGMLVLSKSFGVLKAALTPRVLPEQITLVKTNSRLTVFGLIAGGVSGGIAAGIAGLTSSAGALGFTAACGVVGGWLCLRIPAWVESTEGEVPVEQRGREQGPRGTRRRVLPRPVSGTLWTAATIRVETGFLALFIAFVIKSRYQPSSVVAVPGVTAPPPTDNEGFMQLLLLGAVGAAAGLGGFVGNALGARLPLRAPQTVALACLGTVIASVLLAFLVPGLVTAGVVAFVGSTASSLAKVCLDSTIQHELPEVSRASAFGRSESVLQLTWVFGGVIGLLIGGVWVLNGNAVYLVGFGVIGLLLLAGLAQCLALRVGRSLLPRVSLRELLHLGRKNPTAPLPRPAGPAPYLPAGDHGSARSQTGSQPAPGARSPRSGSTPQTGSPGARRSTRKAGRPR